MRFGNKRREGIEIKRKEVPIKYQGKTQCTTNGQLKSTIKIRLTMDKTFDDLRVMLKANYPLLYFATSEYERVKQKARRIAFEMDYTFNSWDIVEGLSISWEEYQNNRVEKIEKHKLHGSTKNADAFLGEIESID
jgi:hypothetical protein